MEFPSLDPEDLFEKLLVYKLYISIQLWNVSSPEDKKLFKQQIYKQYYRWICRISIL